MKVFQHLVFAFYFFTFWGVMLYWAVFRPKDKSAKSCLSLSEDHSFSLTDQFEKYKTSFYFGFSLMNLTLESDRAMVIAAPDFVRYHWRRRRLAARLLRRYLVYRFESMRDRVTGGLFEITLEDSIGKLKNLRDLAARDSTFETRYSGVEFEKDLEFFRTNQVEINGLLKAAREGRIVDVGSALSKGLSVNVRNGELLTPLMAAVNSRQTETAEFLLNRGANPNIPTRTGVPALTWAVSTENSELTDLLLDHDANPNQADLYYRATPFMLSIASSDPCLCERMLHQGADPRQTDVWGRNAAVIAIEQEKVDILRMLLDWGIGPNEPGPYGGTLLGYAAMTGSAECLSLLLERGAYPNLKDKHGATPLALAAYSGFDPLVRELVEAGAEINHQANDGSTPLALAVRGNRLETVELLIELGADRAVLQKEGKGPFDSACSKEMEDLLRSIEWADQGGGQKGASP